MLAKLGADVPRQHLQSTLCGRICGYRFTSQLAHHRTNVDNFAVSLLDHSRKHSLCYDKRRVQVNIYNLAEVRCTHFQHGGAFDNTCIIDQNINYADFLLDLLYHRTDLCFICHVAQITLCVNPLFFICSQALFQILLRADVEYNLCACLRKTCCYRKADTIAGPGNQSNFPVQPEIIHCHF